MLLFMQSKIIVEWIRVRIFERDPQQSRFWILILFFRADWIGGVQKKVEDVGTRFSNMMADLGYAGHVLLDEVGRRGLFSDCMIS